MSWSYMLESAAFAAVERSFIWNYKMKITDQCSQNRMIDISIALLENVTLHKDALFTFFSIPSFCTL